MPASKRAISSFVVGVTGGIGSGKTTVCNQFAERFGVPVIDADIVAREVVEPGQPALARLVAAFGQEILDPHGALDRRKLKSIVFADPDKRLVLEGILHPEIRQRMHEQLLQVTAPYCLLCIPLLAEGGRNEFIDRVLVVDCPESRQMARVKARDNLTEQEVAAIMRTQATRETRLAIADDVVINDYDNESLSRRIGELHDLYMELAAKKSSVTGSR